MEFNKQQYEYLIDLGNNKQFQEKVNIDQWEDIPDARAIKLILEDKTELLRVKRTHITIGDTVISAPSLIEDERHRFCLSIYNESTNYFTEFWFPTSKDATIAVDAITKHITSLIR